MSYKTTSDEDSKKKIAKKVISEKRMYFFPDHGRSIEAESSDEAIKKLTEKDQEEEDATE